VKRPFGVTLVVVLMSIGAGLLALGSLAFFALAAVAISAGADGPLSQLYLKMGALGAGIFLVLSVAYAALAIYMFRLVYWARLAAIVSIAVGLLIAVSGILASLPRPAIMVFAGQVFVIVVDVWILWYLMRPHVKDAFAAQRDHPGERFVAQA
jgi:hypothetical protein